MIPSGQKVAIVTERMKDEGVRTERPLEEAYESNQECCARNSDDRFIIRARKIGRLGMGKIIEKFDMNGPEYLTTFKWTCRNFNKKITSFSANNGITRGVVEGCVCHNSGYKISESDQRLIVLVMHGYLLRRYFAVCLLLLEKGRPGFAVPHTLNGRGKVVRAENKKEAA